VLLALTALGIVAQASLSGWVLLRPAGSGGGAGGWLHYAVVVLHVAMLAAPPALAFWAYLSLVNEGRRAAGRVAAFLRFAFYIALLSAVTGSSFESSWFNARGATGTLLWAARTLVTLALPIALIVYLKRSRIVAARYGRSFSGQVGDAQMLAISRDGAICVLLMVASLLFVLTKAALPSIRQFGWSFLVTSEWRPNELPGAPVLNADGDAVTDPDTGETLMQPRARPCSAPCR